MSYLSKVFINPRRKAGLRYISNPQATHAAIMQAFPPETEIGRPLWRLEKEGTRAHLLVLSNLRPDWSHITEEAGWGDAEGAQAKIASYQPLIDLISRGREFHFKTTVNPVHSTTSPQGKYAKEAATKTALNTPEGKRPRGTVVPHKTVAHQTKWFQDRVERWGFELSPLNSNTSSPAGKAFTLTNRNVLKFKHTKGSQITLNTATFEGLIRISDPEVALNSLLNGVGQGKAYGCGLITLTEPQ
ncbi:type I-E CRISPR-associated protein Cas6/Cse3/CasE [Lysinibacter sp. HNR]|uniref:type I-E CRISPR-associated protein Cas6/Cse3/CasE n=1 Tax=Lysinibacter sp. HNR TaxID=3031408 RepID=UPI002434CF1B|nr:type I-E CRISPR-associated protein Cas6/Cse3/CasE [Lysinibacter sp. HNR]WGD37192.1 type I-E CRISPR-associated protein Cas6/Cse3/CasE [Lysinibacter sp. HNR]